MKVELKAAAKLAGVDVQRATKVVRKNPLLSEEIHIQESLVNLEESLESFRVAERTLEKYPKIRRHVLREQRIILHHCIGALFRMIQGADNLPRQYSEKEVSRALTRLIRIIVDETARVSKKIDREVLEIVTPFLSLRQRLILKHRYNISVNLRVLTLVRIFLGKIIPIRQFR